MVENEEKPVPEQISKRDKLYAALSKFQGETLEIEKSKEAKVKGKTAAGVYYEYSYKYAELGSILKIIRPLLSKHGLCLFQTSGSGPAGMWVRTVLGHESGQSISNVFSFAINQKLLSDIQKIGGAITYIRRYEVNNILGLFPEDDNDGNGLNDASGASRKTPDAKTGKEPEPPSIEGWQSELDKCKTKKRYKELESHFDKHHKKYWNTFRTMFDACSEQFLTVPETQTLQADFDNAAKTVKTKLGYKDLKKFFDDNEPLRTIDNRKTLNHLSIAWEK